MVEHIVEALSFRFNKLIEGKSFRELVSTTQEQVQIPLEYGWLATIGDGILGLLFILDDTRIEIDLRNKGRFTLLDAQSMVIPDQDPEWVIYVSSVCLALTDTLKSRIFSEKVLSLPDKAMSHVELDELLKRKGLAQGKSEETAGRISTRMIRQLIRGLQNTEYVRKVQRREDDYLGEACFTEAFFKLIMGYESFTHFRNDFPRLTVGEVGFDLLKEIANEILLGNHES